MMSLDLDFVAGDNGVSICCKIYMKSCEYRAAKGLLVVADGYSVIPIAEESRLGSARNCGSTHNNSGSLDKF
jgi:hypothetical protein